MLKIFLIGIIIVHSLKSHSQVQMAENDKLATYCKVWGFLKYYHPVVATGNIKWDIEFKAKYKQIDSLNTKKEINKFYSKWLKSLGDVKSCAECNNNIADSLKRNLDLSWMNDSMSFDKDVIKQLHYIEKNRNQISKYYINVDEGNLMAFAKEKGYYDSIQPSPELRMLGLARYWNVVNYFFASKYLIGEDWNAVLTDMIPKFKDAIDTIEYHKAILELTARTNDSHAGAINAEGYNYYGNKWTPFIVKIIDNKAIITNFYNDSLAQIDNMQYGDVILKINNVDIEEIIKEKSKYIAAGNEPAKLRKLGRTILNGDSDMVDISFERNGTIANKTIHRYTFDELKYIEDKDTQVWEIIDTNVGYVNMGMLKHGDELETIMKLKNTLAIIFDLRNSTNNTLRNLAFLLSDDKKPFAILTLPNIKYPGVFTYTDPVLCGQNTKYYYPGKVMLLINENTQGLAEFTCIGLQTSPNVTTIGSQTAGALGNVSMLIFPGGFETYISGTGVYYPDGKETQRVGITPDIEVKPTIESIKSKRDELLEKALDIKRK